MLGLLPVSALLLAIPPCRLAALLPGQDVVHTGQAALPGQDVVHTGQAALPGQAALRGYMLGDFVLETTSGLNDFMYAVGVGWFTRRVGAVRH